LTEQIRRGPGAIVDFTEVAPFPWDRLYVFGPYTSSEQINQCLGFRWQPLWPTSFQDSKGVNLVVFVYGKKVVHWFEFPRGCGELGYLADCKGYARAEARFLVQQDGEDERSVLRPGVL
jgi:hypothetical protein